MSKKEINEYKKSGAMVVTSVRLSQAQIDFMKENKLESGKLIRDLLDKFIENNEAIDTILHSRETKRK